VIFAIIGYDGPDGQEKRKLHRQAHLDRMTVLDKAGQVLLAGPFTDKTGSLIVVDMPSLEEVRAFIEADPYRTQGVFARYEIHPFMQVFPQRQT
jgi:uncharacterized protein YciI